MTFSALTIATALALAVLYGARFAAAAPSAPKSLVKTLAVTLLALAGIAGGAPLAIVGGLALGAVGDWFLSRPGERAFLAGMASFALGHLVYAAAFLTPAGAAQALWPALAVLALALSTEVWLTPHTGALRQPVRAYTATIVLMAAAALTLPAGTGTGAIKAGALLFVLSDALLALELFVLGPGRRPMLQRALWAAYWAGQALILIGSLPATP